MPLGQLVAQGDGRVLDHEILDADRGRVHINTFLPRVAHGHARQRLAPTPGAADAGFERDFHRRLLNQTRPVLTEKPGVDANAPGAGDANVLEDAAVVAITFASSFLTLVNAVLTQDGQIQIPRELREQLGFQTGNVQELQNQAGTLVAWNKVAPDVTARE